DQEQLAACGLALGADRELAGETTAIERAFTAGEIAGLAGGFTRAGGLQRLVDDLASDGRVLLEVRTEALVNECLHHAGDVGIQLALGLAFKLGLRQLHADYGHYALTDVVAEPILFHTLDVGE